MFQGMQDGRGVMQVNLLLDAFGLLLSQQTMYLWSFWFSGPFQGKEKRAGSWRPLHGHPVVQTIQKKKKSVDCSTAQSYLVLHFLSCGVHHQCPPEPFTKLQALLAPAPCIIVSGSCSESQHEQPARMWGFADFSLEWNTQWESHASNTAFFTYESWFFWA